MTENEPMLERVRKLLAKAEAEGCTAAEQAALIDKAAELIAKYGLSAALAQRAGRSDEKVQYKMVVLPAPYAKAKANLLNAIADPLRVELVYNVSASRDRRDGGYQVTMIGWRADLERLEALFTSLLLQSATQMSEIQPAEGRFVRDRSFGGWTWSEKYTPTQIAAARRDWLEGYGQKVASRLREAEQGESSTTPGAALMLADRSNEVELFLRNMFPVLKSVGGRTVRNNDAFDSGYRAGATADLGGTRVTRGKTRELTR